MEVKLTGTAEEIAALVLLFKGGDARERAYPFSHKGSED